ncbi:MAG: type II secretion system protein GspC [bacterium]|nr:PDZ domain-containing protein [Myxococcales bacterium]MCB9543796.1 PDZ domain-containing protein [Myxococcales bacterium]
MESLVKRYFWVINVAVLAILAFLAAKAINNVVAGRIATLPTRITAPEEVRATPASATAQRAEEWALAITARNLFNANPPDPEEAKAEEPVEPEEPELDPDAVPGPDDPCDKSDAAVSLLATMVAEPAEWSMAAIEDGAGERLVRIGQELVDRRVMGIHRNRLVFANGGRFECVELGERAGGKRPTTRASMPPTIASNAANDVIKNGVRKTGANSYEIDRAMLNDQLDNLEVIARQARVIPHYRDGKPQGFKIVGVRPNSLYSHIGVRSGDVLKSVNGEEITSPTKALELYEKLKTTDNVTLDVERRGRPTTLEYMIK